MKPVPVVPYTEQEITKMVDAAGKTGKCEYERLRARAAVLLFRHTGLRISDVALLSRSRIHMRELLLHTKKSGGAVKLPLPDELMAALEALPIPRGADKQTSTHSFISGNGSARTAVSVLGESPLMVFQGIRVKDAHVHRFRHTLATETLANGGTMVDVADILGISEAVAEKHYAKWNQARQDRITALMSKIQAGTDRAHKRSWL